MKRRTKDPVISESFEAKTYTITREQSAKVQELSKLFGVSASIIVRLALEAGLPILEIEFDRFQIKLRERKNGD